MSLPSNGYTVLHGTHLRETDKAVHFEVQRVGDLELESSITAWFPFSQISRQTYTPSVIEQDTIEVADWICRSKGLI